MSNLAWALQLLESLENDGDELADQERPAEMLNDALRSFEDIVHKVALPFCSATSRTFSCK